MGMHREDRTWVGMVARVSRIRSFILKGLTMVGGGGVVDAFE